MFQDARYKIGFKEHTFNDFCEAYIILRSRVNSNWVENEEYMFPFVDMINHSNDPEVEVKYDLKRRGMVVTAIKDVELGSEITVLY